MASQEPKWAYDLLQTLKVDILQDAGNTAILVAFLTVLVGIFCYTVCKFFMRWTETKPWWPGAMPRQKALMLNFQYTEEACTPDAVLEGWAYVMVICIHHFTAGLLLCPVTFFGWEGNYVGQLLFYAGLLLEMAFDIFDAIRQTCLLFCPSYFTCMNPVPCLFYIIGVVCHHQLGIFMTLPMLWYYDNAQPFHRIVCSLMLAAGISYSTGAYKFTLDTTERSGFLRYKAVVVTQLTTIYYTRLYIWFTEAYKLLELFQSPDPNVGSQNFVYGGFVGLILMSLFNLIMTVDATTAAIKWLPRSMPSADEDKEELEKSKSSSSLTSIGAIGRRMSGQLVDTSGARKELNQGSEMS